ncbi:PREDICTED: zinc finger protein 839 isoform X2 [Thamnophis sirtalis]|uniref:Zinc finger protein 839 isoform X2 n=1 Tax=Thamnophis sirtalis TaxID=35019 RepID=A0A6I9YZI1_9SAUR|nr:PREDICTED: zinc finger protein 839 isoform X2 [Thamnophis sirtalis]
MSSLGFRSDAAAATSEGSALGPPGETPLTPVSEFPRWKPHRAAEAVAVGGVPGKLQGEGLPPPVGKAAQKAEDRRTAGPVVLPHEQSPAWPPPLLLALSFNPETSASPSGSRLTTVGTLHSTSQPGQDGVQEMGSEAEHLALTGPLLAEMKTTHFQIESDQIKEKKSLELFSATALPKNIAGSQAVEKNSKPLGFSAINTEIFQIHTLTGTGSQHFFLCNSSKPTVQLLLPASLHPPGQVPLSKIITHGQKHKSITKDREDSSNVSLVPSCSAKTIVNEGKQPKEQKIKKSLKVTTRSGRISHPPKYKVKDYKFIKTEDLADCHPSDSDDYSELSLEDDECNKVKEVCELFNTFNNDLRPKLFKCQNCEKSYIGKGGLSRHYRINPGHGHQESSESSSINRFSRMTQLECAEKANCESNHQPSSPLPITLALVSKNGLAAELEKNLQTENEHQSEISAEDRKSEAYSTHLGPGRRKRQRRSYQPKMANRSRCSTTFNSLGQLSSNSLSISAEHLSRFKRKEKLKELIQQCTNEEFMELVVPRMTTVVTVFEFLLMKLLFLIRQRKDVKQKQPFQIFTGSLKSSMQW